ncbi:hypothetical protein ACWJKU_17640 [Methylocaldum sp. MU1018]|jgi:hypothetical protein
MMQLLVGLTVIFVVFVIYEVFKTVSRTSGAPSAATAPEPKPGQVAATPAVVETAGKDAAETERGGQLRNPATGEVSPAPTNYRFAKKWVKEALVAEGLLDRVYKPAELSEAAVKKTKDALDKLKTLDKYRA